MQVFPPLKSSLWHLRDNWRCIFFPALTASFPVALHFPRSDPARSREVLFTRLSSKRSGLEREGAVEEIRWRSCHPSRCLDQDTSLTFNIISASTSCQSACGSAARVACSPECVYKTKRKRNRYSESFLMTALLMFNNAWLELGCHVNFHKSKYMQILSSGWIELLDNSVKLLEFTTKLING